MEPQKVKCNNCNKEHEDWITASSCCSGNRGVNWDVPKKNHHNKINKFN